MYPKNFIESSEKSELQSFSFSQNLENNQSSNTPIEEETFDSDNSGVEEDSDSEQDYQKGIVEENAPRGKILFIPETPQTAKNHILGVEVSCTQISQEKKPVNDKKANPLRLVMTDGKSIKSLSEVESMKTESENESILSDHSGFHEWKKKKWDIEKRRRENLYDIQENVTYEQDQKGKTAQDHIIESLEDLGLNQLNQMELDKKHFDAMISQDLINNNWIHEINKIKKGTEKFDALGKNKLKVQLMIGKLLFFLFSILRFGVFDRFYSPIFCRFWINQKKDTIME